MKILMANKITCVTLVGIMANKYPLASGNCFSVEAEDNNEYKIVNFVHENIEELSNRGFKRPFKIAILGPGVAVVHDERIPDEWYADHYCEVCCPRDLLPINQRMKHLRHIACGYRVEKGSSVMFNSALLPKEYVRKVEKL